MLVVFEICFAFDSEVVNHDEFLNLSAAQVSQLISSDRLAVSSEEQVRHSRYHDLDYARLQRIIF